MYVFLYLASFFPRLFYSVSDSCISTAFINAGEAGLHAASE